MTEERRLEMFPSVLRAAARVSVVIRSAAGIDRRGLHVTNIEALSVALERLRPAAEAICLVDGFSLPRCAVPHRRGDRGRRHQRRDRRRLGDRQGDPRPLHAARRATSIPAGASTSTSATRPPSTAPRSRRSGSRRCTAARSSRSPTPSGLELGLTRQSGLQNAPWMCSTSSDAAGAVEGDADGVEADLGVGRERRGARPSRRWRGGGPAAACGGRPRGPGARGRRRRRRARP